MKRALLVAAKAKAAEGPAPGVQAAGWGRAVLCSVWGPDVPHRAGAGGWAQGQKHWASQALRGVSQATSCPGPGDTASVTCEVFLFFSFCGSGSVFRTHSDLLRSGAQQTLPNPRTPV